MRARAAGGNERAQPVSRTADGKGVRARRGDSSADGAGEGERGRRKGTVSADGRKG